MEDKETWIVAIVALVAIVSLVILTTKSVAPQGTYVASATGATDNTGGEATRLLYGAPPPMKIYQGQTFTHSATGQSFAYEGFQAISNNSSSNTYYNILFRTKQWHYGDSTGVPTECKMSAYPTHAISASDISGGWIIGSLYSYTDNNCANSPNPGYMTIKVYKSGNYIQISSTY